MNFSPTMKTYHLPDSGGSYISRYRSISSHIKLTLSLDESVGAGALIPYKRGDDDVG